MDIEEYIKFVNRTYNKTCSHRAVLPYLVGIHVDKPCDILDFGAGKDALGTLYLRNLGYKVTAFDIGENFVEGLHDPDAIKPGHEYRVVMASNVVNVQPAKEDVVELFALAARLAPIFFFNYPDKPRKSGLKMKEIVEIAKRFYESVEPMGISGSKAGYCRVCCKLRKTDSEVK
jgi:hypothetical protein